MTLKSTIKALLTILVFFKTADATSQNWYYYHGQATVWTMTEHNDTLFLGTSCGLEERYLNGEIIDARTTVNSPLESPIIYAIEVDSEGTRWIGTQNVGLQKIYADGTTELLNNQSIGLFQNCVSAIEIISPDDVWIGFCSGGVVNIKDGQIIPYFYPTYPIPPYQVRTIAFDGTSVWIGTLFEGVVKITDGNLEYVNTLEADDNSNTFIPPLHDIEFSTIYSTGQKFIWFASKFGLIRYNQATGSYHYFGDYEILDVEASPGNLMDEIWFYGQNGVQHTDSNGNVWNLLNMPGVFDEHIVSTLLLPEKQLIYFGSIDKVIRYNFQNVKLIPTAGTPKLDRQITHIFKEQDGTIWFGGNSGKVTKFVGGQFEDYNGLNYPNAFFPNIEHINRIDGKIWASTYGSDLMQIDGSDISVQTLVPNNPYLCFAQAPDGDIWVGCDYGIIQNPGPNQVWHIPWNNGFSGNITHDIDFDSQGRLWVATDNALHRFTGTDWVWYHSSNTPGAPNGTSELEIDAHDNIWMIEKDLHKFDGDSTWQKYSLQDWGMPASAVPSSIFIDENGYIWVTTWYDGMVRFNPDDESFLVINQANSPLGDNGIRTVCTDEMGGLWIAMNGHDGIFYFGDEAPSFTNNLEVPSKTLQVFPNPASSSVEIMAEDGNEISKIILLDSSGRKLSITTGHYFSYTMDLSQLPKGLYFIVAQSGHSVTSTKLIKY